MARRCGALLPSGKRCPSFVADGHSSCGRCEKRIFSEGLDRITAQAAASAASLPRLTEQASRICKARNSDGTHCSHVTRGGYLCRHHTPPPMLPPPRRPSLWERFRSWLS